MLIIPVIHEAEEPPPSGSTAGCALVLCKPNMVYTVPPNVGATLVVAPCGCPVIPGLGAHKGRPYGCVQDDDSDQTNITPG